ncbi:MAG: OsmC family protein [Pseudaminobacter sp.]
MSFRFKEAFHTTQSALDAEPGQALATFSAQSRLGDGVNSQVAVRQFSVGVDEPPSLGGGDTAPNPVEYILAALGSCQEITYRLYADALGIPVNNVSVKLDGHIDLRGFFDVDKSVRPGYRNIVAEVAIDSPASEEQLLRLKQIVDSHCPVLDILQNQTPVELTLRKVQVAEAAE